VILVVAKLDVPEEHRDAFKAAAAEAATHTRDEPGCLAYDLHESVEQPGRFVFVEQWQDEAALDRHAQSAHMSEFRTALKGKLTGADIVAHEVSASTKRG
jgi:quinol monooxygenase YgiN